MEVTLKESKNMWCPMSRAAISRKESNHHLIFQNISSFNRAYDYTHCDNNDVVMKRTSCMGTHCMMFKSIGNSIKFDNDGNSKTEELYIRGLIKK